MDEEKDKGRNIHRKTNRENTTLYQTIKIHINKSKGGTKKKGTILSQRKK